MSTNSGSQEQGTTTATARLEMFSDGVFAIAITLLVLEMHVPEFNGTGSLFDALKHEWAQLLAFFIGFMTILICWINHHYMFTMIHRSNSAMILVNGGKLLVVTITPFATALLSKNLGTEWESAAVSLYCFNFLCMGAAMSGIWFFALRNGMVKAPSDEVLRCTTRLYIFPGIIAGLIFLISFFSIAGCLVLSAVMFIVYIFPEKTARWLVKRSR
ncbi:MAG: TMEM175 family protein [Flavobacteriales bacterium]